MDYTHVGCTHVGMVTRLVTSQCCKEGYKWFRFTFDCYLSVSLSIRLCRVCAVVCTIWCANVGGARCICAVAISVGW